MAKGVVVGRYGGGSYYELHFTILEEEWTETPEMELASSLAERVRIHRFRALEEGKQAPFPFHHKGWPARWLRVGDTWMHEGGFGADAIGLPGGTARYREVYKLEKIEERDGRLVAVVAVTGEMEIRILEEDPLLGRLEMHLKGATSGVNVVDLRSGATPELSLSAIFHGEFVAYGMPSGEVELRIHIKMKERVFEAPTKPAEVDEEDRLQRLEAQLRELAAEVAALRETVQAQAQRLVELAQARPLRIGIVDIEAVFSHVFLELVKEERAAMEAKAEEIRSLEAEYAAGRIKPATYEKRYLALQAEFVQARLHILLAMLNLMITAPAFAPMEEELILLQAEVQRLGSQLEEALTLAPAELPSLLQQLAAEIQRLDHLLTQLAAAKILEIAQEIAREMEMDIVLRTKYVVLFYREAVVVDLSPAVEARLRALFRERH